MNDVTSSGPPARSPKHLRAPRNLASANTLRLSHAEATPLKAWEWIRRSPLEFLVTCGVLLDWLPNVLLGQSLEEGSISGTRLLVLPCILLDMIKNTRLYLEVRYGLVLLIAILVGMGGSVLMHRAEPNDILRLLPSVAVLFFFLRYRPAEHHLWILRAAVLLAAAGPLSILLVEQGVISVPERAIVEHAEFTRVRGMMNWSSLGLFCFFAPASLGGLLLSEKPEQRLRFLQLSSAMVLVALSLLAALMSGQRSAMAGCLGAFLIASAMQFRRVDLKLITAATVLISTLIFCSIFFAASLGGWLSGARYRFTDTVAAERFGGSDRAMHAKVLLTDVLTKPSVIGPGQAQFSKQLGGVQCHMLLGEAYYAGGIVLLVPLLWGIVTCALRLVRAVRLERDSRLQKAATFLLALFAAFAVHLSTHAGMGTRAVFLCLGVGLAVGKVRLMNAPVGPGLPSHSRQPNGRDAGHKFQRRLRK